MICSLSYLPPSIQNDRVFSSTSAEMHIDRGRPFRTHHRFVHVPICTPFCISYVPHKKFSHSLPRSSGSASSRATTNKAESTTSRHSLLFELLDFILLRRSFQIFLFSVVNRPTAFWATSRTEVRSASWTMDSRFLRISLSDRQGRESESRQSNQSASARHILISISSLFSRFATWPR